MSDSYMLSQMYVYYHICRSTFRLLPFVQGWHLTDLIQLMRTSCFSFFSPRTGEDISSLYLQQDTVDNNTKEPRDTALLPPTPRCLAMSATMHRRQMLCHLQMAHDG